MGQWLKLGMFPLLIEGWKEMDNKARRLPRPPKKEEMKNYR